MSLYLLLLSSMFLRGQEDSTRYITLIYQCDYDYGDMDSMERKAMELLELPTDTVWIEGNKVYQKFLMQNGGLQHRVYDGPNEAMDLYIDHSVMRVNIYYRGLDFKGHFQRKVDIKLLDSTLHGSFDGYSIVEGVYEYQDGTHDTFALAYLLDTPKGLFPDYHQVPGIIYRYSIQFMGVRQTFTLKEMRREPFELPTFVGFEKMTEQEFMKGMSEGK